MPPFESLKGQTFGYLTVLEDIPMSQNENKSNPKITCKCVCGKVKSYFKNGVKYGTSKSCGCKRGELVSTHGETSTALYFCWCNAKKNGILHFRWHDFEQMLADVGDSSLYVYRKNRRRKLGPTNYITSEKPIGSTVIVTINGEHNNLAGWAQKIGVTRERARQLHREGKLEERVKAL